MATYTPEQQEKLDARAAEAAAKELANDPNIRDAKAKNHKGQQERVDKAIHELRVSWGLEK